MWIYVLWRDLSLVHNCIYGVLLILYNYNGLVGLVGFTLKYCKLITNLFIHV